MKKQRELKQSIINKAIRHALEDGISYVIVEVDGEFKDRVLKIWPYNSTKHDNFIKLEGIILAIFYSDGSYEMI